MKTSASVRCAIYTRKSTEEGLDQAFNSLDAQREACAAYIESQKHEGWKIVRVAYDDGGFSGGTMERPALTRLLADVDAGLIDTVVVYKIDRLTRSLADFAKIVERFEKRSASFVSVTQSFNTTTSMGRLTLNVLLSFAQFEREVTAERIRDKIAASRAKGIFMGGCPPLGYDARDRKLVINEKDAATVRRIFERYLALGSVGELAVELNKQGITTKLWVSTAGKEIGGGSWYVGPLNHLLRNRVYVGEAVHKDKVYPGQHEPILERRVFDRAQTLLEQNRVARKEKTERESPGLLTGLIFDDRGNAMTPQLSRKPSGLSNVYYVSQALLQHRKEVAGTLPRVSARAIEGLVIGKLEAFIDTVGSSGADTDRSDKALRELLRALVRRVTVGKERVVIELHRHTLDGTSRDARKRVDALAKRPLPNEQIELEDDVVRLLITTRLKTYAGFKRTEGGNQSAWTGHKARPNKVLIAALTQAHRWRERVERGDVSSIDELIAHGKTDRKQARLMLRLAFLAPDIQRSIVQGRQPANISLRLLLATEVSLHWTRQRDQLGLPSRPSEVHAHREQA